MCARQPPASGNARPPAPSLQRLLAWYDRHRRDLPWRALPGRRPDPYHVLLSECMLQQTTAATVSRRFPAFLARFPSLAVLAAADEAAVLQAWQGLGYYRRARALHALARAVMARHAGVLPQDEAALRALPGVGAYTASAVRAIAFDQPVVPVDGNVQRVLARMHRVETPLPAAATELTGLAAALRPRRRTGDVAQALRDLGATLCRPRQPRCRLCPWHDACAARSASDVTLRFACIGRPEAMKASPIRAYPNSDGAGWAKRARPQAAGSSTGCGSASARAAPSSATFSGSNAMPPS